MLRIVAERIHQRYRTVPYPAKEPSLPPRFRGRPVLHDVPEETARAAMSACPAEAIGYRNGSPVLDLGRCIFCGQCERIAPEFVTFSGEYRMAALNRNELFVTPRGSLPNDDTADDTAPVTPDSLREIFKRSFRIREVSAAGCNACEADCNVLTTVVFDLARFGIDFVASPRHADAVLVTGPVPRNMHLALQKCYAAMPEPKVVIAVGACAISGGLFSEMDQDAHGVSPHLPVDVFVPGCPPNPYTILHGLLRFLRRAE
ncbi:MAG: NAD(P)H-quinone oxidoreductase subunit K, chloroplastic [Desulfovibrio sp.]